MQPQSSQAESEIGHVEQQSLAVRQPPFVEHHPLQEPAAVTAASELSLPTPHEQGAGIDVPLAQLPHPILPQPEDVARPAKKSRRRYNNDFKAGVLNHLKISGLKLPAVAKQYNIPENTLREWTKITAIQAIQNARQKHGGTLKANLYDPMHRLIDSLMSFFGQNEVQPPETKVPITTKLIVSKALEARKKLLELHEIQPFLDLKEQQALESFTGSDSWAKKFAKRHNLKMSGYRIKELNSSDFKTFSDQIRDMAQRMKVAGPGYEEVAALLYQAGEKLSLAPRNHLEPATIGKL